MKKLLPNLLLIGILLGSFFVRLYKINNPVADWHSWRQADTAAVARNFIKFGFSPMLPRYDDLSNVQSGKDNPEGYRMVEFPLYQALGFSLYQIFPQLTIEIWLRLVSIGFSLLSIFFLYLLVKKYVDELTGLLTAFIFAFLPYSIYYSRAILPEMTGVGLALAAIWFLDKAMEKTNFYSSSEARSQTSSSRPAEWDSNNKKYFLIIVSAIFSASALLVKPTVGFLLLPAIYLFCKTYGKNLVFKPSFYLYGAISLLPLFLWRIWISQFPEGVPAWEWLLNEGNIRFKGAFFRWILAERLGKLILGYMGLVFFFLGIVLKPGKRENWLFWSFLAGTILYVMVFSRGNVQHDYYQVLLLPAVSIFAAKGLSFFLKADREFLRPVSVILGFVLTLIMLALSWYEVRGYYWINHPEIVEAGKRVDELVPQNAKVIAPYNGDTAFLYQTNRSGWPVMQKPIPEMVKMGASILVIVNPDKEAWNLEKSYQVLEKKDKYIIFDIQKVR